MFRCKRLSYLLLQEKLEVSNVVEKLQAKERSEFAQGS